MAHNRFSVYRFFSGVVLLLTAFPTVATTIHVPADKPTIQAAIDAAVDGDTILVAAGTYTENIDFKNKVITVQSTGGAATTIIDGANVNTVIAFGMTQGAAAVLQGFTIQHGSAPFGAGIFLSSASPTIVGNIFVNNAEGAGGFGAAIGGSGSPDIEKNVFQNNTCDSQFLSGVVSFVNTSSPTIADNVFLNNPCRAINMTLPVGNSPAVVNNTIVGNAGGIRVDARVPTSQQSYENNVLVNNTIGLEVDFLSAGNEPTWKNNLVFGNGTDYSGITSLTGASGNISVDPLFVSMTTGDFHLQANSPAIDAGSNAAPNLPEQDIAGNDRILDGKGLCAATVDIGAYEFARASSLTLNPVNLSFPDQLVGTTSGALSSTVTNNASAASTVCTVTVSGDFAQTNTCASSISSKGSCNVNVTFLPTAHGPRSGFLQIITNDAGSPQSIVLSGKGVIPAVSLSPPGLNFSAQQVGTTSSAQSITLNNTGDGPLAISNVVITGDFSQNNTCGSTVVPSTSCTFGVTFAPTAAGSRSGSLTISDNAAGSPHSVNLTGTANDFSLAAAANGSTSASVAAGGTATYNLQVTALNGFGGTVTLTCTGPPSLATCSVSPNSVTPSASGSSFTATVVTMAPSLVVPRMQTPHFPRSSVYSLALLVAILLLLCTFHSSLFSGRRALLTSLGLIFFALACVTGCTGGSSGLKNPGTPTGTYTLVITGTANGASHDLKLTLTVN